MKAELERKIWLGFVYRGRAVYIYLFWSWTINLSPHPSSECLLDILLQYDGYQYS